MLSRMKLLFSALILIPGAALAAGNPEEAHTMQTDPQSEQTESEPQNALQEAAATLAQMKADDEELGQQVSQAKGVFVIPDYATASLLVGGSGGEGVMLQQQDGEWSNPAFYNVGSIDVGAQAGAAAGAIVMLLMSDEAVNSFQEDTNFSLTSQAGLTIINWSADTAASTQDGDVLVWSDTEGLLAEASVGVSGISWDEEENGEYYGTEVTAQQILAGEVENPHEDELRSEFAEFSTQ